ncbi:hypothetical protein Salat_1107000 [Sesamum alatum]|uniref:Uncharacterized protein n=1 Tax=Sesamum alatum TaxID=300844 RepID=A0AAE1YNU7_9LAMI|nr:hypothetical protein Salat_1107000 [Sesamum alatum]
MNKKHGMVEWLRSLTSNIFDLSSNPSGRNIPPMTVPRPGPVTPARAAPRKLEGRTTELEALPRAPAPARGRCLEPPARPESSSRHCLEPPARGPPMHCLEHQPAARGRCLELGWYAGSARGSRQCLEHQLVDRPARAGPAHQRPPRAGQRTSSR